MTGNTFIRSSESIVSPIICRARLLHPHTRLKHGHYITKS